MAFSLTEEEYALVAGLPEEDLVDLAAELSITVDESIDHRSLLSRCVVEIANLAGTEGLPFSEYDRHDITDLPDTYRRALAARLGVKNDVKAILKSGRKIYKLYNRDRKRSQVPLVLPSILLPLCRHLSNSDT